MIPKGEIPSSEFTFREPAWHISLPSTNAALLEAISAGQALEPGHVLAAQTQTSGRGKGQRAWHSPRGNLYASFLLRLDVPGERLVHLPLAISMAVGQIIRGLGLYPIMKWPNDILLRTNTHGDAFPRKVCGVLCEAVPRQSGPPWNVVCGVGLNVNANAETLYAAGQPATSLYLETRQRHSIEEVLMQLLRKVEQRMPFWAGSSLEAGMPERSIVPGIMTRLPDVQP